MAINNIGTLLRRNRKTETVNIEQGRLVIVWGELSRDGLRLSLF